MRQTTWTRPRFAELSTGSKGDLAMPADNRTQRQLAAAIAERRNDQDFAERLRRRLAADQQILRRLAEDPEVSS